MKTNFSCGDRIRELRVERSLSQEQLALTAGITPAYLGLVERSKRNATVVIIERICTALNISLADFFSTAQPCKPLEDEIGRRILHQLSGLSDEEKLICLQLIKNALQLRLHGLQGPHTEEP
ncbi:MAG: helix-turn-helix transcriptional regulator [Oscillospiraceae bacterium]|nr:helix-turn-helix transcriptional regulator [Oscillospiraceae bacterium]